MISMFIDGFLGMLACTRADVIFFLSACVKMRIILQINHVVVFYCLGRSVKQLCLNCTHG